MHLCSSRTKCVRLLLTQQTQRNAEKQPNLSCCPALGMFNQNAREKCQTSRNLKTDVSNLSAHDVLSKFEGTCSHFGKICKHRQTQLKTYASFVGGKGVLDIIFLTSFQRPIQLKHLSMGQNMCTIQFFTVPYAENAVRYR